MEWWAYALMPIRIILPFSGLSLLLVPTKKLGPEIRHIIISVSVVALDTIIGIYFTQMIPDCNTVQAPFATCNDPLYCCVFQADPSHACPNRPNPCVPNILESDLKLDRNFLIVFIFIWVFVFLEGLVTLVIGVAWLSTKYYVQGKEFLRSRKELEEEDISSPLVNLDAIVSKSLRTNKKSKKKLLTQPKKQKRTTTFIIPAGFVKNGKNNTIFC